MLLVLGLAPARAQHGFGAWTVVSHVGTVGTLSRKYMHTSSDTSHTLVFQCSDSFLDFGLEVIVFGPIRLATAMGHTPVSVHFGSREWADLAEWGVGWDERAAFAPLGMSPKLKRLLPTLDTFVLTLTYADGTKVAHAFGVAGFKDALDALDCPDVVQPGQGNVSGALPNWRGR